MYKLDDSVLIRIVQIIQEAMLTGTDCIDYMRLIELHCDDTNDSNKLMLTDHYKTVIETEYKTLLEFAEKQKQTQN